MSSRFQTGILHETMCKDLSSWWNVSQIYIIYLWNKKIQTIKHLNKTTFLRPSLFLIFVIHNQKKLSRWDKAFIDGVSIGNINTAEDVKVIVKSKGFRRHWEERERSFVLRLSARIYVLYTKNISINWDTFDEIFFSNLVCRGMS